MTNGHLLVLASTDLFRGNSTIEATLRLRVTLGHIRTMSAKKRTGVPRWKEQLDAALEREDMGATNAL